MRGMLKYSCEVSKHYILLHLSHYLMNLSIH